MTTKENVKHAPETRFIQQACGCTISHDPRSPFFPITRCPLHAAAPELYHELQEMIQMADNCGWGWNEDRDSPRAKVLRDARAAVARVRP